ncbi:MAG: hypothetical protein DPW16_16805 [Chloroflexi bacterium]|nr:hypothetical protein [Chloroflexota bacterium]
MRPENKPRLHFLSLAIAAIGLAVVGLFVLGVWLETPGENNETDSFTGFDLAARNVNFTEDFPSGIMFILPIVVGAMTFQFYRRIATPERPGSRVNNALMLLLGIVVVLLWMRTYTLNVTDALNESLFVTSGEHAPYTNGDIIRDFFTSEIWLCLALSVILLILPFFDKRPAAASIFLNPERQGNFKPKAGKYK